MNENKKLHEPYSFFELEQLLMSIEDWLLTGRNIKVHSDRLNLLQKELFDIKFNPEQMQLCKLYIKYGKWAVSKKDLELSDFFPTKEQISHLQSDVVSREYYSKKIQFLKNEHLLDLSKLKHELTFKPLDSEEINVQFNLIKRISSLVEEIESQKKQIKSLDREIIKLKKNIFDKDLLIEAEKNQIKI